ncbi:delta-class carbonic anhydrase [Nisaea acidiphila]|uniref:Delta-class carbonic anhydrase n=1 Tax=Nisaea acidiphila TaxID=1862145 RepID=A0A9J7AKE6_9PROT|nr:delta-class carbonic anhydrase [Nisaea acidiphila]UUX48139.1 delta-class carbonic anhydrase [Nisaea acidiphila]
MKKVTSVIGAAVLLAVAGLAGCSTAEELCQGYGPQTPRDITRLDGKNTRTFALAPAASEMNLCDIHTHTNAEHKGPGYAVFAGSGTYGRYQCNESASLTAAELAMPAGGGAFSHVKPGDTIEVHWVHTTCDAVPAHGLGSCLPKGCDNPQLRVEAQVFLVVNDPNALDFTSFDYRGTAVNGLHQAKAIPGNTGTPVVFRGSTTGPSFTEAKCSPLEVTWSVRPNCAKVDINSIYRWAENDRFFKETKSHGVRQLVTAPELLSKIE